MAKYTLINDYKKGKGCKGDQIQTATFGTSLMTRYNWMETCRTGGEKMVCTIYREYLVRTITSSIYNDEYIVENVLDFKEVYYYFH